MNVRLTPELEKLIEDRVAKGEYASPEALIEAAVLQLSGQLDAQDPSPQHRLVNLNAIFEEADRDPAPRTTPLPDEAFDRENLYDDRA